MSVGIKRPRDKDKLDNAKKAGVLPGAVVTPAVATGAAPVAPAVAPAK
jgi:hypothetical protein